MKDKELNTRFDALKAEIESLKAGICYIKKDIVILFGDKPKSTEPKFKKGDWIYRVGVYGHGICVVYSNNQSGVMNCINIYHKNGIYIKDTILTPNDQMDARKATTADMLSILIPYAESKGYNHGVRYLSYHYKKEAIIDSSKWYVEFDGLWNNNNCICVLNTNEWVEIVKQEKSDVKFNTSTPINMRTPEWIEFWRKQNEYVEYMIWNDSFLDDRKKDRIYRDIEKGIWDKRIKQLETEVRDAKDTIATYKATHESDKLIIKSQMSQILNYWCRG